MAAKKKKTTKRKVTKSKIQRHREKFGKAARKAVKEGFKPGTPSFGSRISEIFRTGK